MGQEILKNWQKNVIQFLASSKQLSGFYLTGGTALAGYYLHHRISDDLDFFSYQDIDPIFIHKFSEDLKNIIGSEKMRFSRLYDRNQFFYTVDGDDEYKIEFTKYPFPQLEKVNMFEGLKVDSERDIAVNKLLTIADRFDPKDYVDLYFLLSRHPLEDLRRGVEKKFGVKLDYLTIGSLFGRVKDIVALPRMVKLLSIEELKKFFSKEAKKLSSEILK